MFLRYTFKFEGGLIKDFHLLTQSFILQYDFIKRAKKNQKS